MPELDTNGRISVTFDMSEDDQAQLAALFDPPSRMRTLTVSHDVGDSTATEDQRAALIGQVTGVVLDVEGEADDRYAGLGRVTDVALSDDETQVVWTVEVEI